MMTDRRPALSLVLLLISICAFADGAFANCGDKGSPLAALFTSGTDDGKRIPLILIHGVHGTSDSEPVNKDSGSWKEFEEIFDQADSKLTDKYALYLFQYCSDRENVASIALKLRDLIDAKLTDRPHVIVTHSMGGIIATSYMAETKHQAGKWKGKTGGDTIIGLITLAAPHHGSPAANDPDTVAKFIPSKYEVLYSAIQRAYWRSSLGENHPGIKNSSVANRSDLRWDNYDGHLDTANKDVNTVLAKRNKLLEPYGNKIIAYAASLDTSLRPMDIALVLIELEGSEEKTFDDHHLLTLANIGLVYGLGNKFGDADGLVPLKSGLLCKDTVKPAETDDPKSANVVCHTLTKVRRFESGIGDGEVSAADLPDEKTLSIYRTRRGFDHLDMLVSPIVLEYVVKDLRSFAVFDPQPVKFTIRPG